MKKIKKKEDGVCMINKNIHIKKRQRLTEDEKISLAILSPFFILSLQYIVLVLFNLMESNVGLKIQMITKILVGLIYLLVFPTVFKRNKIVLILTYLSVGFIFLLHYTLFVENRIYMRDLIFPLFFMCLPAFIYTLSLNNFKIFKNYTVLISYGIFGISLFLGFLLISKFRNIGSYSMTLSYYVLLPAIVYLGDVMNKFSLIKFINFIISLFIIISLGSRGAIMCIIVFFIMKLSKLKSRMTLKNILCIYVLFCITIICLTSYKEIVYYLNELLLTFNIESRTLSLFLLDDVYLSGRNELFSPILHVISENFISGIGIGGDRLILDGIYVHNIFLEILVNYGVFIGGVAIVFLCLLIFRSLISNNFKKYDLVTFWLSFGFIHLMVSGSYLTDMRFWIFIGLLINLNSKCAKRSIEY